jgi:hypothetical protein
MSVTPLPAFPQTPKSAKVQILNADASALKTIYTGGANGSKITAVIATSSDTSNRDVTIGISRSGTFFPLATITVPLTAGQAAGVSAVNLLDPTIMKGLPVDNDGQVYIYLSDATDLLQAKALTTVTTAKEIDINSFGADF